MRGSDTSLQQADCGVAPESDNDLQKAGGADRAFREMSNRGLPMTVCKSNVHSAAVLLVAAALVTGFVSAQAPAPVQKNANAGARAAEKAQMEALGRKYKTATELFEALRKQANGGKPVNWQTIPDWAGVYTRTKGGTAFDPDGPPQGQTPLAKFTPEYKAKLDKSVADRARGIEYDPLSQCESPTYPRWFDLPFMREFIVTPGQTTMIAEAFNSIRRIYTDGRGHIPAADAFPTETGDSIGFWDGDRLIVHTNSSMAHMYERAQGFYSDQVEGVEIWHKINAATLVANVWIYDPPALLEPWYTRQSYTKLVDPAKLLRINNWSCKGNPNNDVYETEEGGSQHGEFTFTKKNAAQEKSK
jgi:hypothetical protein